ncbi:MAG: hypothetical protein WCC77_23155, partial [Pseudolabrys sp.]
TVAHKWIMPQSIPCSNKVTRVPKASALDLEFHAENVSHIADLEDVTAKALLRCSTNDPMILICKRRILHLRDELEKFRRCLVVPSSMPGLLGPQQFQRARVRLAFVELLQSLRE